MSAGALGFTVVYGRVMLGHTPLSQRQPLTGSTELRPRGGYRVAIRRESSMLCKRKFRNRRLFVPTGKVGRAIKNRDQYCLGNKDETSHQRCPPAICVICGGRVYDQEQGMPWGKSPVQDVQNSSRRSTAKIIGNFLRFDGHVRNEMETRRRDHVQTSRSTQGFSESEDRVMGSSHWRFSGSPEKLCFFFLYHGCRERKRDVGLRIIPYTEFVACGRAAVSSRYHPVIQSPWLEKF